MNVVALAKYVPNPDGNPPEMAEDGFRLRRDQPNGGLDPSDEPGIELAVRLAEQTAGAVTVISMGPEPALRAVRRALALGADRGVLVTDAALAGADALTTARVLAVAVRRVPFDLVIAGVESTDGATGTMPMALAALLGVPSATFARRLTAAEGTVAIERQTDRGHDVVEAALPALVTVTAGAAETRYPSVRDALHAKKKPVEVLTLADLALDPDDLRATHEVVAVDIDVERDRGELVENPHEAVSRIVQLLRATNEVRS